VRVSLQPDDAVIAIAIERALGERPVALLPLSGGDVASSYRVELADVTLFAKTKRGAPDGFFTTEALGLRWLRAAGAVAVPEVVAVGDDPPFLALEWIEPGGAVPGGEQAFGVALARLHASGAPVHGREDRRSTGSRGLPNDPCSTWSGFYATQRLLPLADMTERSGALPDHAVRGLRSVVDRIDALCPPEEPPSRLHGDLWGGNRLIGHDGTSWLIDPAAIGGHREFDLAMMRLFGGFGEAVYRSYGEVSPFAPGWERRVALHQLAPLVVHAIKFGGPYVGSVVAAIAALD
jgi:fructosamine-3-kinase